MDRGDYDLVCKPKHYTITDEVQVRDIQKIVLSRWRESVHEIKDQALFEVDMGNVVKYILRAPLKDGRRDLEKAQQYLSYLLDGVEPDGL